MTTFVLNTDRCTLTSTDGVRDGFTTNVEPESIDGLIAILSSVGKKLFDSAGVVVFVVPDTGIMAIMMAIAFFA